MHFDMISASREDRHGLADTEGLRGELGLTVGIPAGRLFARRRGDFNGSSAGYDCLP